MIRPSTRRIARLGSAAGTAFHAGHHRGQRDSLMAIARLMKKRGDRGSAAFYVALARSAHRSYLVQISIALVCVERSEARLMRLLMAKAEVAELSQ